MIKKFNRILKNPFIIPKKIFLIIVLFFQKLNYKESVFIKLQNEKFNKLNLNREIGLIYLKRIKETFKIPTRKMSSEHEVFFSSLACKFENRFKKILEIDTFYGNNSLLLSRIFKSSEIDTIDLDSNSDEFKYSYDRLNQIKEFSNNRSSVLKKNKNIKFIEMNSIKLCNHEKKYDLIWIDGAHGYPIVCIDILNSLRLLNENGLIMCDDVYINKIESDNMYSSIAAYETLTELQKEKVISLDLIYKRLDIENNFSEKNRKFIAIIQKI